MTASIRIRASVIFSFWLLCYLSVIGQTVSKVGIGGNHVLFIEPDDSLWSIGENSAGAAGDGSYNDTNSPEEIVSSNVIAMACGGDRWNSGYGEYSFFIKSDGSLWAMGQNRWGQLGDGTIASTNRPEQIISNGVVAVVCGMEHSLFLKSDSSLWGMGDNGVGQLGVGTSIGEYHDPVEIVASNVIAVTAGDEHSLFLKSDGSLWAMGWDAYGQLGDGAIGDTNAPVEIVSSNVVAISAKYEDSFFIKSDGSLWGMGWNRFGQLGDGTTTDRHSPIQIVSSNVVAVTAGVYHTLFLKSDSSLWGMGGINDAGELGDGTVNGTNAPEQIISGNVVGIAAGAGNSLFIRSDGHLWGMGVSHWGELGASTDTVYDRPVQIVPFPAMPIILSANFSGANLQLHGTNGIAGGTYYTLMTTNLTLPLNQWTPVTTNVPLADGVFVFTVTNAFDPIARQGFYRLQLLR